MKTSAFVCLVLGIVVFGCKMAEAPKTVLSSDPESTLNPIDRSDGAREPVEEGAVSSNTPNPANSNAPAASPGTSSPPPASGAGQAGSPQASQPSVPGAGAPNSSPRPMAPGTPGARPVNPGGATTPTPGVGRPDGRPNGERRNRQPIDAAKAKGELATIGKAVATFVAAHAGKFPTFTSMEQFGTAINFKLPTAGTEGRPMYFANPELSGKVVKDMKDAATTPVVFARGATADGKRFALFADGVVRELKAGQGMFRRPPGAAGPNGPGGPEGQRRAPGGSAPSSG